MAVPGFEPHVSPENPENPETKRSSQYSKKGVLVANKILLVCNIGYGQTNKQANKSEYKNAWVNT